MRANDVLGLIHSARNDWGSCLLNPRAIRIGNTITWKRDQSFFFSDRVQYSELLEAAEEGQYSMQFFDGSLVQMYYSFDEGGNHLVKARLAYYGAPDSHGEGSTIWGFDAPLTNWFRLDYDRSNANSAVESFCHIHFGGLPKSRIIVNRVPNPRQFIEMLMAWCYPDEYATKRLTDAGAYKNPSKMLALHAPCTPPIHTVHSGLMIHVLVPGQPNT